MILGAFLVASASVLVQHDSIRDRLYVQAELTWYGSGSARDMSNRLVRTDAIRRLGFGGTRLPFEWPRIEAERGRRDWARTDSVLSELERDSLAAYGLITYSPKWAVPVAYALMPRIAAHRPVVDGSSARGDTLFAAFAAAAARRYRGRIDRWEIWNEENHPAFWMHVVNGTNRGADPADYTRLFSLARDSILRANPQAQVVIGGLTSLNGFVRPAADPLDRTRELLPLSPQDYVKGLVATGMRLDIVAIHPYSTVAPGIKPPGLAAAVFPDVVVDSVFAALDQLGLRSTTAWVTEWGVNVTPGLSQDDVDSWFRVALTDLLCHPRISLVTIHALADANSKEHFGLLNPNGTATPNGKALSRVLREWRGCPTAR